MSLMHLFCQYLPFPSSSGTSSVPLCRPSCSASPQALIGVGAGKVQSCPGAMCSGIKHVGRWGGARQGWKELKSHSSPLITYVLDPHTWASAFSCCVSTPSLGLYKCLPHTPQPVLPLPALFPLAPYTSSSSPRYHLASLGDPKPQDNQSPGLIICSVTVGKSFLQAPPNQTRESPRSQCHPGLGRIF